MTTIGRLNYQLGMDTANFSKGSVLTRREMQLVRRELRASVTPTEAVGEKIDALGKAFEEGAIGLEQYARSYNRLTSGLPEAKAAQDAHNAAVADATRLAKSVQTPLQGYLEELARNKQLLDAGHISQEIYNEAAEQARQLLPEVRAAQEAENQAMARAAKLTEAARDPMDSYNAELAENKKLLDAGRITQETYNHAAEQARRKLPEVAEAERELARDRQRAMEITRRNETEAESYGRQMREVARLLKVGAISERDYAREAKRIKNELPSVQREQRQLNESIQQGRALTRSLMTAEERRGDELRQLRGLLDRGHITQETYNRGVVRLRREQLAHIPVIGRFTSGMQGVPPAVIGVTVALGGLVVGGRIAIGIIRGLTGAVREQLREIDALAKSATKLGESEADLFALGQAARELSSFEFGPFETAMQRMTRRIAEAAAGGGEAKGAIAELGLDANALNLAGPVGAFGMVADAMREIDDEGTRLRLAFKLFDSEGAALVNTLAAGSDVLDDYKQRMRELGALPDPFDSAAAQETNDALKDVSLVLDGLARDLTTDLAPTLVAIAEEVVEVLKPGSTIGDQIRFALEAIPPIVAFAADQTNTWIGMFQLAQAEAQELAATVINAAAAIDRGIALTIPTREANAELQAFAATFSSTTRTLGDEARQRIADGLSGSISQRMREIKAELAAAGHNEDQSINIEAEIAGLQAIAELRQHTDELTTSLSRQTEEFGLSQREVRVWRLEQEAARAAAMATTDATREEAEALRLAAEDAAAMAAQLDEMEATEKLSKAVQSLSASLHEQAMTAGMTADEVARWKLEQQGATDHQLEMIAAQQEGAAALREIGEQQKAAREGIKSLTESLTEQIATFGMSREEAELWKLSQAGASKESLAVAKSLAAELKALKERDKLLKQGEQLTKSMRTPLEDYRDEFAKLKELREASAISEEIYSRALAKTTEELIKSQQAASQGIDGTDNQFEIVKRLEEHKAFLDSLGTLDVAAEPPEVPRPDTPLADKPDVEAPPEVKGDGFVEFTLPDIESPDVPPAAVTTTFDSSGLDEAARALEEFRAGLEIPSVTVELPEQLNVDNQANQVKPDLPADLFDGFEQPQQAPPAEVANQAIEVPPLDLPDLQPSPTAPPPEPPRIDVQTQPADTSNLAALLTQSNILLSQLVANSDQELEEFDDTEAIPVVRVRNA